MKIMMMAFLLGLMIPAGIIYLLMATDTKVRSRRNLKGVSVPFAGEIPISAETATKAFGKRKTLSGADSIVVRHGNRNVLNEAFRVLRTNFEFHDARTWKQGHRRHVIQPMGRQVIRVVQPGRLLCHQG